MAKQASDDDIKAYAKLVADVHEIDPAAAEFLSNDALAMPSFHPHSSLKSSFVWGSTPQGWHYWNHIHHQLTGDKDEPV